MKLLSFEIAALNLNEEVAVRLTDRGRNIWRTAWQIPESEIPLNALPGGFSRFQLWELMYVFGSSMQMGFEPLFERNEIFLIEAVFAQLKSGAR
jgi:hypothetical protein